MISDTMGRRRGIAVAIALSVVFSLPYIMLRDYMISHPATGYMALFAGCLVCNLSLFVPSRSTLLVVLASMSLDWRLCALAGGLGAGVSEVSSYMCGRVGWQEEMTRWESVLSWIRSFPFASIYLMAALPIPGFDIVGIIAGIQHIPLPIFMLSVIAGKTTKYAVTLLVMIFLLPRYMEYLPLQLLESLMKSGIGSPLLVHEV